MARFLLLRHEMRWRGRKALLLALALCGACSDEDAAKSDVPTSDPRGGNAGHGPDEGADDQGGDDDVGPLPPEDEEALQFDAPQAGEVSVYVPNPITHRVAVVNAQSFAIETLQVGKAPTYTATVPGQDVAIVLNVGSRDAALLRTAEGKTSVTRLPVGHDANAIAVAPDGLHAVVYFDAKAGEELAQTFQDVTVVSLTPGEEAARGVSVGFRARAVDFTADGSRAFVITEDGISVIDLRASNRGPQIARLLPVGDKVSDPVSSDIQITRDGAYALARRDGDSSIRLIDLTSGAITALDLRVLQQTGSSPDGGTPEVPLLPSGSIELTDVDLSPDGTFVLAVVRNMGLVLRLPMPEGLTDPSQITVRAIEDQLVGSVAIAKTGTLALAYTTARPVEGLVIVDLTSDAAPRSVRLRKAVRAVALSDDGSRALVLHAKVEGDVSAPNLDEEARIDRAEGYSLVDTQRGFAKLKLSDTRIRQRDVVVSHDASRLFALLRDDSRGISALESADLRSFQIQTIPLAKPPSSLGLVPGAARVFVGQESEGGMITFLDLRSGDVAKAVTGFELSSRIRQ